MAIHISTQVVKILEARGLLPKNCRFVEIQIPAVNALVIRYEVYLDEDAAAILAEAFAAMAAEARDRETPSP